MAKKEGRVMDFGVRLRGDLADVFERERRKEGVQKAAMVRRLVVEALRARGHSDVKDEVEWGGYRPPKVEDESEGQPPGGERALTPPPARRLAGERQRHDDHTRARGRVQA